MKLLILIFVFVIIAEDIGLNDGKPIIIYDDGTWRYINEPPGIEWDDAVNRAKNKKILDVPIFTQDPEAVPEGWCASTSIQMILSYYGLNFNQEEINNERKTDNPTIYFEDIATAIIGITNNKFKAHLVRFWSADLYKEWIIKQIDNNKPVFASFTYYPLITPESEWMLIHHYSVISGYDEDGLYILNTWENKKEYRTWKQLLSKSMNGLSFVHSVPNKEDVFFAFDIYQ